MANNLRWNPIYEKIVSLDTDEYIYNIKDYFK